MSKSQSAKMIIGLFPPSSSVTGMSFSAAALETMRPTSTEPVKVTLLHLGVGDQGRAAVGAEAAQHVEAAGGEDAVHQLADAEHCKRRFLGGLDDDGVAGDQRRGDLERHQEHGHVPRE